jgi:hypothetical protein
VKEIKKIGFGERVSHAIQRVIVGTLLSASLIGFSSGVKAAQLYNVTVKVNGYNIVMAEAPAYIDTNSQLTYVPLRFVSEALGAEIGYTSLDDPISATLDKPKHHEVKVLLNEKKADIDGKVTDIEGAPVLQNGRTMVPLRVISEGLGADVKWIPEEDGQSSVVDIKMVGAPIPADTITWNPTAAQRKYATQVFKQIRFDITNKDLKVKVPSVEGKEVSAGLVINGNAAQKLTLDKLYEYNGASGIKLNIRIFAESEGGMAIFDKYDIYSKDNLPGSLQGKPGTNTDDIIVVDQYKKIVPLSAVLKALGL